ncbi:1,6-anhydro-N-acetylmuramyl-L-alanine amidase AmpD [Alteromonas sp. a30]|uniref:1,6-anhydro-N-acetylmuramyl-L-alanine amidase AmpD n=1 Tax=Alteromonas sp. a30 TaxID=2730917 RepID=UPI0022802199|nr:1,6-anhydro-N-acetylmuramyl-L-alanine amidase AmpD [Alteromonas sp. a30]MCY7294229.1 1,6-anhydro-N-acetylmuramyl-L-alanine amidase AmpD [Alteromonas sp. a30]
MDIIQGKLGDDCFVESPFYNQRPLGQAPNLLVIHNISLPPGQFGGPYIHDLFTGKLNADEHPFFQEISHLQVSAHCLIRRSGEIVQFVNFNDRAWHAGVSTFQGRENCNDYSIGIEMEGTDVEPYTDAQYQKLIALSSTIMQHYPEISLGRIVGHNDIAFGRKTDPGVAFDWCRYRCQLVNYRKNHGVI